MSDEEIAVRLEAHDHEIGSLKHRIKDQEEQSKMIQDLVLSVKELALNMEAMLKEQSAQGSRLAKLEAEPAEQWHDAKKTIINTILGAIAGAAATGLIYAMFRAVQ